jgi:hypothetical protein
MTKGEQVCNKIMRAHVVDIIESKDQVMARKKRLMREMYAEPDTSI